MQIQRQKKKLSVAAVKRARLSDTQHLLNCELYL